MAKHWIQKAVKKMKKKGTVGSFTAAASRAGMGVQAYANKVLSKKSHASAAMKKKANFARNAGGK
jgi:hypothetical protein